MTQRLSAHDSRLRLMHTPTLFVLNKIIRGIGDKMATSFIVLFCDLNSFHDDLSYVVRTIIADLISSAILLHPTHVNDR